MSGGHLSSPVSRLMIRRVICCIAGVPAASQCREGRGFAPDRPCARQGSRGIKRHICASPAVVTFGGVLVSSSEVGRSDMSLPDDDDKTHGDNVVRLGNDTLFAIADGLRRMYDA